MYMCIYICIDICMCIYTYIFTWSLPKSLRDRNSSPCTSSQKGYGCHSWHANVVITQALQTTTVVCFRGRLCASTKFCAPLGFLSWLEQGSATTARTHVQRVRVRCSQPPCRYKRKRTTTDATETHFYDITGGPRIYKYFLNMPKSCQARHENQRVTKSTGGRESNRGRPSSHPRL